jgi:hypothetical protein
MMEDHNWTSRRAQEFQHDLDAGRSFKVPVEDLWVFASDYEDTSSESDGLDTAECEMPALATSESDDFAPYSSKTVSDSPLYLQVKTVADIHHNVGVHSGSP